MSRTSSVIINMLRISISFQNFGSLYFHSLQGHRPIIADLTPINSHLIKSDAEVLTNFLIFQTLQDDLTGAVFHPLDDNLLITHGKGNLTFWIRRKDGFFERTDIIKPVCDWLM